MEMYVPCPEIEKPHYFRVSIYPRLVYRFTPILVKIPAGYFLLLLLKCTN
jgi:hypothetical protein